jgi:hypothetical protein
MRQVASLLPQLFPNYLGFVYLSTMKKVLESD